MRRRNFLFGFAAIPISAAVSWAIRNRFVMVNHSGETIISMTVKVCDTTFHFSDVLEDGTVSALFGTPEDESGFQVEWIVANGSRYSDYSGYVVWEDYGKTFHLTIKPDGLVNCQLLNLKP